MKKLFYLPIFMLFTLAAGAQDGTLDTQFGTAGWATTQFQNLYSDASCMAIQPDGKILVAGVVALGGSTVVVCRFTTTGALDNTFGTSGRASFNLNVSNTITCMALQSDGKIILGGDFDAKPMLVRLTTAGALDNTFDSDGHIEFDDKLKVIVDIRIVAGDKILGCANATDASNATIVSLFRRNSNGTADTSFGTNGFAKASIGDQELITRMTIANDGKVLVTGSAINSSNNQDLLIARFNSNGSLDTSFDTDGWLVTNFGNNAFELGNDVSVQADGKIVIAGRSSQNNLNSILVARFNSNGSKDTGFGTSGRTVTSMGSVNSQANTLVLLKDGRILVGGGTTTTADRQMVVVRYTAAGVADNTFATNGIAKVFTGVRAGCEEIRVLANGKILAAGFSELTANNRFMAVARFNGSVASGTKILDAEAIEAKIFPNPTAGGSTNLTFNLEEKSNCAVRLVSFDGRQVADFFNENLPSGEQNRLLELPAGLPTGLYFVQIRTEKGVVSLPLEVF